MSEDMVAVESGVIKAAQKAAEVAGPVSAVAELLHEALLSGALNAKQWEALVVWMTRHDGEDGTPDYELLGGATAQRWISRELKRQKVLEADKAEAIQAEIDAAELAATSESQYDDLDVQASAIEYVNERDYAAFTRVWSVLELAGKNALRRAVTKAANAVRNDEIKSAMAASATPLSEIPEAIWSSAKLDTSTRYIIDTTVDEMVAEVGAILTQEMDLLPKLGRVLGQELDLAELERSRAAAIHVLENELGDSIAAAARPRHGEPVTVVPPSLVRKVMAVAGGADPEETEKDGFPVRKGRRVVAGFGALNGPLFFALLEGAPTAKVAAATSFPEKLLNVKYKWRHAYYREPMTPFPAHKKLNGRVFLLKNWDSLLSRRKDPDTFPYVDPVNGEALTSYRVGDHEHCTCAILPMALGRGRKVLGAAWFDDAIASLDANPEAIAAAFNPNQPRCPVGTGQTAGRFSNEQLVNCNPLVTQLNDRSLQGRIDSLMLDLQGEDLTTKQRSKLEAELELARTEAQRRAEGGTPDDETNPEGVSDDPANKTQGEPDRAPVELSELDDLANEMGGFTVRDDHDSPTTGYAVAFEGAELPVENWRNLSEAEQEQIIAQYFLDNEQMLIDNPRAYVGAWIADDGTMYLDLSEVVGDLEEAARLGYSRNQLGIFGFEDFETLVPTEVLKGLNYGDRQIEAILSTSEGGVAGGPGEEGEFDIAALDSGALDTRNPDIVGPRRITGKSARDDGGAGNPADLDFSGFSDEDREWLATQAEKHLQQIPGMAGLSHEEMIDQIASNYKRTYDAAVAEGKPVEGWKMWYTATNNLSQDMADAFGLDQRTVAATLAVLSPTSEWGENVANANRGLEVLIEDPVVSEEDAALAGVVSGGRRLSEMSTEEAGNVLGRMFSEQGSRYRADPSHAESVMEYHPDGSYTMVPALSNGGEPTWPGTKTGNMWVKATEIFRSDGSDNHIETIANQLGRGAKVRSFYNNMIDPFDPNETSVTMDSHAISNGTGIPVGSGTALTEFGGTKIYDASQAGTNGSSGLHGSYATFQAGLTQARDQIEAETGIRYKVSELQSITWMQWREQWSTNSKGHNKGNGANRAAAVWKLFESGSIDLDETYARLDELQQELAEGYPIPGARTAAFNPDQPRCPIGTGLTAGRFSNEQLTNCLPMVTQLKDTALELRLKGLAERLGNENLSTRRRNRLETEVQLVESEIKRREEGGRPEGDSLEGVDDTASEETQAEPDYADEEIDLDEMMLVHPDTERDTQTAYQDEHGNYTKEREDLHNRIVEDFLDGAVISDNPTLYMTGGGPASGKSSVVLANPDMIPGGDTSVRVDADLIKAKLPEYNMLRALADSRAAAFVHEESSDVSRAILGEAFARNHDVVYDSVGNSSVDRLAAKIQPAKDQGFRVVANYASLDTELALKINDIRAKATGRAVPPAFVRKAHSDVSDTFVQAIWADVFDEANLWDTNVKDQARLTARYADGRLEILEPDLWDDFVAKGTLPADEVRALLADRMDS